jgi:uncharacterized protein (TIGR02246 family)
MKMHLLLTLAGLVIGFALPTFAQKNDAVDPELMKAVLHSCQVFDNAFNNNDPEALANLFTEDATLVTDSGVLHGRDDILKYQIGVFKVVHFGSHKNVPISAYPIGTDGKQFWATGSWSHTVQVQGGEPTEQKGFWSAIIVNDGTGKHVMQTWNITPAPAPTTTPSPTSSKEEKNTVDPEVRQQIEALLVKGDEAFNKHDAAALADWYTDDAVFVGGGGGSGPHYGRQSIEKRMALDMASFPEKVSQSHELLQVNQLGVDVVAISKLAVGQWKGYGAYTFVRETDGWKIRMAYVSTMVE